MLSNFVHLGLAVLVLFSIYRYIIYPVFLSPLSKLPAPHWSCHISQAWILWQRYRDRENATLLAFHKKLGDILRLGPNEVNINAVKNGVQKVYGAFEKPRWWADRFDRFGQPCMASLLTGPAHAVRRRLLNPVFSKSRLRTSEAFQESLTLALREFKACIKGLRNETFEFDALGYAASLDLITSYLFGIQHGTRWTLDPSKRKEFKFMLTPCTRVSFWTGYLPRLTSFFSYFGLVPWPKISDKAFNQIFNWIDDYCTTCANAIQSQKYRVSEEVAHSESLYWKALMEQAPQKEIGSKGFELERFAAESADQFTTGPFTMGQTMSYFTFELSQNPKWQKAIQDEVRTLLLDDGSQVTADWLSRLTELPILDACYLETLRLWPTVPGTIPRKAPRGGCELANHKYIPEGTIITAIAYCLHRNEDIFEDPESWRPERWLNASPEQRSEMSRWFFTFGAGTYHCSGIHLAEFGIKAFQWALYTDYSSENITSVDDMMPIDSITVMPRGGKYEVKLS